MKILIAILSAIVLFFGSLIITEKQAQSITQDKTETKKEIVSLQLLDRSSELSNEV